MMGADMVGNSVPAHLSVPAAVAHNFYVSAASGKFRPTRPIW